MIVFLYFPLLFKYLLKRLTSLPGVALAFTISSGNIH